MKRKIFISILVLLMSIMFVGCGNNETTNSSQKNNNEKLNIVVSIYPLKEFTEKIAKDKADVICMVPDNVEPHDYEPKTKDFETLTKCNMFIYNGLGMESWVDKVESVISDKNILTVNCSDNIDVRKEGNTDDPHIWLSLKNAEVESEAIKNALISIDEKNKEFYEANYEEFKKELEVLYNEYKPKFDSLSSKSFVTGHAAFGYLCREYGLTQKSVENLFGEGEPTPKQLEELVAYCKDNNIKTIFSESLASPKVSETLAAEVGADVVPILTLEAKEDDKNYTEAMRYNLEVIYECLEKQ